VLLSSSPSFDGIGVETVDLRIVKFDGQPTIGLGQSGDTGSLVPGQSAEVRGLSGGYFLRFGFPRGVGSGLVEHGMLGA
jgi:hypothetical protein